MSNNAVLAAMRRMGIPKEVIQLPDQIQRNFGLPVAARVRLGFAGVFELAASVGFIAVSLQDAGKPLERNHACLYGTSPA